MSKKKEPQFKRPNHADFKDSAELRKEEFTGIRINNLSQEWEIWVVGELRARGPQGDREAFTKAYADVFCLDACVIGDIPSHIKGMC